MSKNAYEIARAAHDQAIRDAQAAGRNFVEQQADEANRAASEARVAL